MLALLQPVLAELLPALAIALTPEQEAVVAHRFVERLKKEALELLSEEAVAVSGDGQGLPPTANDSE